MNELESSAGGFCADKLSMKFSCMNFWLEILKFYLLLSGFVSSVEDFGEIRVCAIKICWIEIDIFKNEIGNRTKDSTSRLSDVQHQKNVTKLPLLQFQTIFKTKPSRDKAAAIAMKRP